MTSRGPINNNGPAHRRLQSNDSYGANSSASSIGSPLPISSSSSSIMGSQKSPSLPLLGGKWKCSCCSVGAIVWSLVAVGLVLAVTTASTSSRSLVALATPSASSSSQRGSPGAGGGGGLSASGRMLENTHEAEGGGDLFPLINDVRKHLQSIRNRMQDRPGAPQVLSSNVMLGTGGGVGHLLPAHLLSPGDVVQHEDVHSTIFVSVAAFRDVECGPTIEDMFKQAKYPHRIFVGIVDQREDGEHSLCIPQSFIDCQNVVLKHPQPRNTSSSTTIGGGGSSEVASSSSSPSPTASPSSGHPEAQGVKSTFCPMDNIRVRRTRPTEARGPTFGRFVAQLMYQGETFFMMIDSHMRFVDRWDVRLLRMYAQLPTRGVISHYPSGYEPGFVMESNHDIMFMCYAHYYDGVGILRNGAKNIRNKQKRPLLQPFTAAGFLFGHSDYVFDVPFDPWLDYLFDGEEILYTVRLWTSGWDAYLPSHDIMYHFYGRPKAPKVWGTTSSWVETQKISQRRVLHLLKMTKPNSTIPVVDVATETNKRIFAELNKYGLGTVRRVEDFWPFAHVDPIKRTSDRGFCDRAN